MILIVAASAMLAFVMITEIPVTIPVPAVIMVKAAAGTIPVAGEELSAFIARCHPARFRIRNVVSL